MFSRSQVEYLVKESFAGFHRRKLTTGVTILIMGSALLVLAILTLATLNMANMLETARAGIDMRVFLRDDIGSERTAELQPRLLVIPGVERVEWISADMALREFRSSLGEDGEILDLLDNNPLPDTYHLILAPDARNLDAVHSIRDEVAAWEEVSDILFNQGWIDSLERWTFRFQIASLAVGLVVFLAAVFVISNTVKLTIASSSRVIMIQKLVGATNAFIRLPYLCEGMIQGLLAGMVAMGILVAAEMALGGKLGGMVFFSPSQIFGFIVFCVVLGLIGSWSAMRKYLTLQGDIL